MTLCFYSGIIFKILKKETGEMKRHRYARSMYLNDETMEKLESLATRTNFSKSEVVAMLIDEAFSENEDSLFPLEKYKHIQTRLNILLNEVNREINKF